MPKPTDDERAAAVRKFYGLDGSERILAAGYRPNPDAPQGASKFEQKMRKRLDNLTGNLITAGPEEATALQEAELPLNQLANGEWQIDRATARSEAQLKEDLKDQQNADNVRKFYGLDGSERILAPGYRPSSRAPQGATSFEKEMRKRLDSLTRASSRASAGPEEATALQEAELPLNQLANGRWQIDAAAAGSEAQLKADLIDQQNADNVREFYGLDGSECILATGSLPSSRAPQGASDFEKSMRKRLYKLARDDSGTYAGPKEAIALQEAELPLSQIENGKYNIDRVALLLQQAQQNPVSVYDHNPAQGASSQVVELSQGMEQMSVTASVDAPLPAADWSAWNTPAAQESAYGVSDFSGGGDYPTNPVTAGPYLASNYGYSHAGQSSYAGSSPYVERPPSRADKPSKRGRK